MNKQKPSTASASSLVDSFRSYERKFDRELSKQSLLVKLEEQTRIPKTVLVGSVALLFLLLTLFPGMSMFLVNIVAVVGPGYLAMLSVNTDQPSHNLMLYFAFFSTLLILEKALPGLFALVPMYVFIRAAVLGWMAHPKFNGAQKLYDHLLKNATASLSNGASAASIAAKKAAAAKISERLSETMRNAINTPLVDKQIEK